MDPVDVAAYAGEVGDTYPGPLLPGERRKSDVECPDRSLADPTETGSAKRSVHPRDGSAKKSVQPPGPFSTRANWVERSSVSDPLAEHSAERREGDDRNGE